MFARLNATGKMANNQNVFVICQSNFNELAALTLANPSVAFNLANISYIFLLLYTSLAMSG